MTTDLEPAELLAAARTIAVVGFSTNDRKAAHTAPMVLVERGWDVVPIHPTATHVAGLPAYATLADVPRKVDLVDVFRPSEEAAEVTRQALEIGATTVWLQLGIRSEEAARLADEAGVDYVEDLCAGALASRLDLFPGKAGERVGQ